MKKLFFTLLLSLPLTQFSLAHSPFLSCESKLDKIHCLGSFSDGSPTAGVKITVLDYSDDLLLGGELDKNNAITLDKPDEEEFYIKFDAGPGHVFEVDYSDINEQEESKESKESKENIKTTLHAKIKAELKAEIISELKAAMKEQKN